MLVLYGGRGSFPGPPVVTRRWRILRSLGGNGPRPRRRPRRPLRHERRLRPRRHLGRLDAPPAPPGGGSHGARGEEDEMDRDVAVYLRVSTDEQTTANQAPEVERLCAARGWRIVARYEETASGAARERADLARMLDDAHRGRFAAVVVWALDRLGRGGVAATCGVVERL